MVGRRDLSPKYNRQIELAALAVRNEARKSPSTIVNTVDREFYTGETAEPWLDDSPVNSRQRRRAAERARKKHQPFNRT